jgi:hypothetical protein
LYALLNLLDRLVDKAQGSFTVTRFIGLGALQLGLGVGQRSHGRPHMGLLAFH